MGTSLTLAAFAGVTVNPTDGVSASSTSPPSRTSYAHTNLASTQRMYTHARCCPTHARGPVANGMNAGPLNLTFNPPSHASREPVSASPDVGTPSAPLPSTSASPALNDVRRVRSVAHSRLDTSQRFGTKHPAFPKRSGRGARRGATRQPRTLPVTSNPRGSHHHRQVRRPARASAPRTAPPGGAVRFRGAPPRAPATCSLVRHAGRFPPFAPFSSPTRDTPVASYTHHVLQPEPGDDVRVPG